ncbi:MAG: AAA family ATPase [Patescibacteria group bacterium]
MEKKSTPIIIGLAGAKGSGKGTVAKYLKNHYGATVVSSPDILSDILHRIGQGQTRVHQIILAQTLRKTFGEAAIGIAVAAVIDQLPKKSRRLIVIDNIRPLADWTPWQKNRRAYLVALHADVKLRFARVERRGRTADERSLTYARFLAEEKLATETAVIAKTSSHAAFHIDTNGSLTDVKRQVDLLARKLGL